MTTEKKYDLLADIAKLIKKYGADTFFNLAEEVSSSLFKERFAEILLKAGKASEEIGFKKPKKGIVPGSQRSFRSQLLNLKETQPKKAELILSFHDELTAKRSLPTLRDIKNFITDNGLQPLNAKSRKNAIIPLLRQLLKLDDQYIVKITSNIPIITENDDRSLAGWSDIILKKKPENVEELKPPKQNGSNHDE